MKPTPLLNLIITTTTYLCVAMNTNVSIVARFTMKKGGFETLSVHFYIEVKRETYDLVPPEGVWESVQQTLPLPPGRKIYMN